MLVSTLLTSCITSRIKPVAQMQTQGVAPTDSSDVKIFLLERDIPAVIEQLGVVAIGVNSRASLTIDALVKKQLRSDCRQLGANGAYRINDGTYYPFVVNYLVFKYNK